MPSSTPVDGRELQVEPHSEWTKVRRKGRRPLQKHQDPNGPGRNGPFPGKMPRQPFLSVSDIEAQHQRVTDQWETSPCCRQLREVITSRTCYVDISEAICFGLGSFDPENGSWERRRSAHVQLAAFLCVVEQLQRSSSHKIRCLFQEPMFHSADKEFLQSLGHQVVDSPEGFERVTPSTLVFGIHLYRDIYNQTIAKHLPAMFVGTPYGVWEEVQDFSPSEFTRMKELDERYVKVEFPQEQGYSTFSTTTIHWEQRDVNVT
ncbi:hypothetical protein GGR52DRAFT_432177 [Hypoxylon sp. FL1284]|nr:hypothetical protein GGR52DRAFT_432177 [Hypoxylon sp. FL1284]